MLTFQLSALIKKNNLKYFKHNKDNNTLDLKKRYILNELKHNKNNKVGIKLDNNGLGKNGLNWIFLPF